MENEERSEAIRVGQARVIVNGKTVGRPNVIFNRQEVVRLRDEEGLSWSQIGSRLVRASEQWVVHIGGRRQNSSPESASKFL